jgi:uncharacterized protein (UPF0333 family)
MKNVRLVIALIILALAFVGVYYIGKHMGESKMKATLIENYESVKQIAELASLEVQGTSEIKLTNAASQGDWAGAVTDLFFENTLQLRVPYTAKYGVDLNNVKINMVSSDTALSIYLPGAKLLSYELKLDRAQTYGKTGWLVVENYEYLKNSQQKLYESSRRELENNKQYIDQAQNSISKILTDYFSPFGFKVVVYFDKEPQLTTVIKN